MRFSRRAISSANGSRCWTRRSRRYPGRVHRNGQRELLQRDAEELRRAVDKSRLNNRIGKLTSKRMKEVNRAIRLSLAV